MLEEKLKAGILTCFTVGGNVPQGRLVSDIVDYVHDYELDILLGPEWLFLPETRLYQKEEKEGIIKELAEKTKTRDTLIIPGSILWEDDTFFYNTAPIISQGNLIGEQHKWTDGGSKTKASFRNCSKPKYKDLEKKPDAFKWRNYRAGVEICSDMGRLLNSLEESCQPFLDLYFLVSDGCMITSYPKDMPVKDFGYGLNSDGDALAIILRREGRNFKPISSEQEFKGIRIYNLTWEK